MTIHQGRFTRFKTRQCVWRGTSYYSLNIYSGKLMPRAASIPYFVLALNTLLGTSASRSGTENVVRRNTSPAM